MNEHRGEVGLKVGEKIYKLKFTINSIVLLEETLGRSVKKINVDIGMKELRAMVWAGLQHNHNEITLERAGDIIEEIGNEYVFDRINEALEYSYPKVVGGGGTASKKKKTPKTQKIEDGAGQTS